MVISSDDQVCDLICELHQAFPGLVSQLMAQARLNLFPEWKSAVELRFPGIGKTQPSFAAVLATALCDPALPGHQSEGSCEGCAVHSEHFAQLALSNFSSQRERLQDGELGGPQSQRAQRSFIKLGQGPRRAAEAAAHAREFRYPGVFHVYDRCIYILLDAGKSSLMECGDDFRHPPFSQTARNRVVHPGLKRIFQEI